MKLVIAANSLMMMCTYKFVIKTTKFQSYDNTTNN